MATRAPKPVRALEGADVAVASPIAQASGSNTGGANQAGVRLYNERLLLSLVRRFRSLVQG